MNKTETTNQYLIHEIRDVIWMIQRDNLAIKLGWAIDGNIDPAGHDERFFDTSMREFFTSSNSLHFYKSRTNI